MTADLTESCDIDSAGVKATKSTPNGSIDNTETVVGAVKKGEIENIFVFLSSNPKITFKSQQIDDPDLHKDEKVEIARDIFYRSPQTFLIRFGKFLEEQHLTVIAQIAIQPSNDVQQNNDEHCDEIKLLIADYRNKLQTRERDIKNRRYAAMQKLIAEGEYFSEQEMMKRAPDLYQELIGQYLSETEKKQRDQYDVKNTTFSGILMHTMEQKQLQDLLNMADEVNLKSRRLERKLERDWNNPADETTQSTLIDSEDDDEVETRSIERAKNADADVGVIPADFRQQWGNFDNEQVACSTSSQSKKKEKTKISKVTQFKRESHVENYTTAGERELLRQEFIGIMHEQFLSGADQDFDYTLVDDNTQLDDLKQLNQDKEDAYFEESDDGCASDEGIAAGEETDDRNSCDDGSEDGLDVYMQHLSRHHSLQKE